MKGKSLANYLLARAFYSVCKNVRLSLQLLMLLLFLKVLFNLMKQLPSLHIERAPDNQNRRKTLRIFHPS